MSPSAQLRILQGSPWKPSSSPRPARPSRCPAPPPPRWGTSRHRLRFQCIQRGMAWLQEPRTRPHGEPTTRLQCRAESSVNLPRQKGADGCSQLINISMRWSGVGWPPQRQCPFDSSTTLQIARDLKSVFAHTWGPWMSIFTKGIDHGHSLQLSAFPTFWCAVAMSSHHGWCTNEQRCLEHPAVCNSNLLGRLA